MKITIALFTRRPHRYQDIHRDIFTIHHWLSSQGDHTDTKTYKDTDTDTIFVQQTLRSGKDTDKYGMESVQNNDKGRETFWSKVGSKRDVRLLITNW